MPLKYLDPVWMSVALACCMRQTLPVPGVPGSGAVQMNPFSDDRPSLGGGSKSLPHSMSGGPLGWTLQRQNPIWQFIDGQSSLAAHRSPL